MSLRDKLDILKGAIKEKSIEQVLSVICPISAECKLFKLKVLAKTNNHDLAILIKGLAEVLANQKDLQTTLGNMLAARDSNITVAVRKARYEGEVYTCVYIDFPKAEKEQK